MCNFLFVMAYHFEISTGLCILMKLPKKSCANDQFEGGRLSKKGGIQSEVLSTGGGVQTQDVKIFPPDAFSAYCVC